MSVVVTRGVDFTPVTGVSIAQGSVNERVPSSAFFREQARSYNDFPAPDFCARQVAGGIPNWVMNHRVNELAIE